MKNMTRLAMAAAGVTLAMGGSIAASPITARADEADRCGGQERPICKEVTLCAGLAGNKICDTEFYYFPSAS